MPATTLQAQIWLRSHVEPIEHMGVSVLRNAKVVGWVIFKSGVRSANLRFGRRKRESARLVRFWKSGGIRVFVFPALRIEKRLAGSTSEVGRDRALRVSDEQNRKACGTSVFGSRPKIKVSCFRAAERESRQDARLWKSGQVETFRFLGPRTRKLLGAASSEVGESPVFAG